MKKREKKAEKTDRSREKRGNRLRFGLAALFAALTGLLMYLFKSFPDFFFPGYRCFSRWLMKVLSFLTSFVPFSLWDLVIAGVALAAVAGAVRMILRKRSFSGWLSRLLLALTFLFFFETAAWNLNHYGPSLSEEMGLSVPSWQQEDLENAFRYYYRKAAETACTVGRDEEKQLSDRSLTELCREAGSAYTPLEESWEVFANGSKSRLKVVVLGSFALHYLGISGEFAGFTGEASVPLGKDTVNLPFSLCHEAGHRLGIASEEDANFAAFLACTASEDPLFVYSGYYSAFVYCYNALCEVSQSRLAGLMAELDGEGKALLLADCDRASAYYAQYDGPAEEIGEKVNDASLKAFSEEEGVKSYSLVVNELISWYYLNSEQEEGR